LARLASPLPPILPELSKCNASFGSGILDVGCGNGRLLLRLKEWGFTNLTGVDLYFNDKITSDGTFAGLNVNEVKIIKGEISALDGRYDVIMLHHSFEHMPEPLKTLSEIHRLLSPDGCALIRMPTVSSYAWRHYGVNWLGLGAPRHFFLHSLKSMEILASQAGFRIKEIEFNSTRNQFWGSEQCLRGIPFNDPSSYACNRKKSIFTRKQIRSFGNRTNELNAKKLGDQISVYLVPLGTNPYHKLSSEHSPV
jgi:SAM-dependent methyltransferase